MATRSLMQRRLSRARRTCQHAGNASGRLVRAIDRSSTKIRYYRGEFSHLRHDLMPQSRSRQKLYDRCYASSFGSCGRCYEIIRFVVAYALKNVEQNRHVDEHWDRAAEHVLNEPHRRATIRRETPRKCFFPVASSSTRYSPIEFLSRRNKTRLGAQPLPTSFPTILSFRSNTISLSVPNFGADIWNTWNRLESAYVELQASSGVRNDTNSSPYTVRLLFHAIRSVSVRVTIDPPFRISEDRSFVCAACVFSILRNLIGTFDTRCSMGIYSSER